MAKIYTDSDADPSVLEDSTVAVVGYGNQGRAQALNLRDSGVNVVIGGLPDATLDQARDNGLPTMSVAEAAAAGDIICLLIPDDVQQPVYRNEILPHLSPGKALDFAHGYNVHYGGSDASTLGEVTKEVLEDNKSRWSGSHLMAPEVVPGILLVNRKLRGSGYDLTDVTATLLDHYGLPPAEGMVGRSIFAN